MDKEKLTTTEIINQYEGGLRSLVETFDLLWQATEKERGFLLHFKSLLKKMDKDNPAQIAEDLLWLQDLMMKSYPKEK